MKFIFIRHAESEGNRTNTLAVPETPLTPEGMQAAQDLARDFSDHIDVLFSSPLRRTLQTAEPLSKKLGLPIIQDPDLQEKSFGSFSGNSLDVTDRVKKEHPEFRDAKWGYNYRHWGGESGTDVRDRILRFVERVKRDYPGASVAAFTHVAVLRIIHILFKGAEYSDFSVIPNASIHEFDL